MRIAVVTRYVHRAGGIETYLEWVLPALATRGHEIAVWHEFASAPGVERFVPSAIPSCQIGVGQDGPAIGNGNAISDADVIFLHGLSDPARETEIAAMGPLVIFLHAYNGTCVSETKTYAFPSPHVCTRALGPGCLLRYYPRRCGGWSPVTMVTSYARQRQRRALLRASAFVATLSAHMRDECVAQGVDAEHVIHLPAFTPPVDANASVVSPVGRTVPLSATRHLLFAGRMERLKGGQVFLDALDRLGPDLRRNLRVTFAGDGRERGRWERQAAHISRGELDIRFVGWLSPSERSALFSTVDLLVVPSIWPEPLGLVGLEAAAAGIPSVAFDVGGIREWLTDGVTGRLVPAAGAGAALAKALEDCLKTPALLKSWGAAALADSRRRTLTAHIDALECLLSRAAGTTRQALRPREMAVHGRA